MFVVKIIFSDLLYVICNVKVIDWRSFFIWFIVFCFINIIFFFIGVDGKEIFWFIDGN